MPADGNAMGLGKRERARIETAVAAIVVDLERQFESGAERASVQLEQGLVGSMTILDAVDLVREHLKQTGFEVLEVCSEDWEYGARVVVGRGSHERGDGSVAVSNLLPAPATARDVVNGLVGRASGVMGRVLDPTHGRGMPYASVLVREAQQHG